MKYSTLICAVATFWCSPGLWAQTAIITEAPPEAAYMVTVPESMRAQPTATAPIVGRVVPLEIVRMTRVTTGWIEIALFQGENKPNKVGWIKGSRDNMLPEVLADVSFRLNLLTIQHKDWPDAVLANVIKHRPRMGFTTDQVTAALGDPIGKTSEETARGTTEVWTYLTAVYTFTAGKVSKVTKIG